MVPVGTALLLELLRQSCQKLHTVQLISLADTTGNTSLAVEQPEHCFTDDMQQLEVNIFNNLQHVTNKHVSIKVRLVLLTDQGPSTTNRSWPAPDTTVIVSQLCCFYMR